LTQGANAPLDGRDIRLEWLNEISGIDVDVTAYLLNASGRVRGDGDMVFFNQPSVPGLTLSIGRDRSATFSVDPERLPAEVERVALCVSLDDPGGTGRLSGLAAITATARSASYRVDLSGAKEQALIVAEIYRRAGQWKIRAVGQGFAGGLAPLARSFGMDVEEAAPATRAPSAPVAPPPPAAHPVDLRKKRIEDRLVSLAKSDPKLVSLAKTAGVSLAKNASADRAAKAWLVLDVSGSMHGLFASGKVDRLVQRALAYALNIDDDGEINVILFDGKAVVHDAVNPSNYARFSAAVMRRRDIWGGTDYGRAMQLLRQEAAAEADFGRMPVYVMFVTDGETSNRNVAERMIREASGEGIFWKFMAIGQMPKARFGFGRRALPTGFDFLAYLDDMPGRVVDNADFFAVSDPDDPSDAEFFDLMANEYGSWIEQARSHRVLRD
jgi:stress response protein SCP2